MTVMLRCLNCGFSFTVTFPSVEPPLDKDPPGGLWPLQVNPLVVADLLAPAHLAAPSELRFLLRLLIAAVLAGVLGWERESAHKPAGLRTHMVVGIASALFTVLGELALQDQAAAVGGWRAR